MGRYVLVEHLHDGAVFSLDRARDAEDGTAVVVKRLPAARSEPAERARLRREFELLRRLDLPGVVQARSLEEEAGELRLVLTDVGGDSLDARLRRGPLPLGESLDLALQLADIVDRVHRRGVLHKDIKPRNILVDPRGQVQLIDFGIASEAPRELAVAGPPQQLEGTLAYIAPEQTGRMNRPVDARSDLYSLGATLYEVLLGRPPFTATDPVELVHCQIARAPAPPSELDPAIPPVLSDMVLKLLAKQADDRYQSALGLHHDLAICRDRLRAGEPLDRFPLATHDVPARFELPARLYGREAAIEALAAALARVRTGGCELVRVGGPPGIGKTAVIGELGREVAACGGRLIVGKFDQLARDRPYSALRSALGQLVEAILAEPEAALVRRRTALERSLGRLRVALLELLPELAAVLGRPTSAGAGEGDSPGAARSRLQRAVRAFVGAFAEPSAPLVLLLDDLQWADAASLELLGALLGPERPPGLLVVATLRDEALAPALHDLLVALEQAGVAAARIDLTPLTEVDTRALVADALRCPTLEAAPLAALLHDRTGGLPLLVGEYLRDLVGHGLVSFDPGRRRWSWDAAAIAGAAVSADVVSLMVERTRSLGQAPRDILARAACLGGEFDAALLAGLAGRPEDEVAAALAVAARSGLIVAGGGRYRFFHDRVQQAVASTLAEPELQAIHLAIGRGLAGGGLDESDPRLFEVVHHFNLAAPRIDDADERRRLAALDLAAARRARASGAFAAVAIYAAAGVAFLGPTGGELRFELELLRAEGQFLSGEYAAAEVALKDLLERSSGAIERARALELWAALDLHVGRNGACVEHGRAGLAALGVDMPRRVGIPGVMLEFLRTRSALGGRTAEQLLALPRLAEPKVRLALRLIFVTLGGAFQLDPLLTTVMTMRALRLSLEHGMSSLAAAQFVSYGLMVGLIDRDVAGMERYGRLALAFLERHPDRGVEAVVKFLYGTMIQPWSSPSARALPILREAIQAGLDSGQLVYSGIAAMAIVTTRLLAGDPLEQVRQDLVVGTALSRGASLSDVVAQSSVSADVIAELTGVPVVDRLPLGGDSVLVTSARDVWRSGVDLIFGRFDEGLAVSERAERSAARVLGQTLHYSDHVFVRAMLQATRDALPGPLGGLRLRRAVEQAAKLFERRAADCPASFEARARLLRAEALRLAGDGAAAIRGYEEAITLAVRDGRPHDEGLACEAAARFFAATGADDVARLYVRRARRAYLRWGALAKVEQLDRLHPGLERRGLDVDVRDSSQPGRTEAATTRVLHLDFASLFKATQVFAEELALDRLLASVMRLVVENAGAERGVLLLARRDGLVGAGAYAAAGDAHTDLREAPLEALDLVPAGVVLLAHRSGRPVIVDDGTRDPRFDGDPYLARVRPRSLLAAPLLHGGEHLGVVYLENNLAAGVFTPARAEGLRLLAVQAAIAIDRALLFGRLDEARRAAEAASVAKTRFLANMSHELRTPLNAILGYCEMLAEEATDRGYDDMLADLAKIQRAGAHLLAIVRDILDLTKIEAGRLDPARELVSLPALLDDVVTVITPDIERNRDRIVRAWPDDLGEIRTDPTLLRQVLLNLLGNAAKFTRGGEVTLRAERPPGGERVRFSVLDTGIGMSEAELKVVFEPFTQADGSSTRRYGGVGLGLTITRGIVEVLGGTIDVCSERGKGSIFVVELPAA